MAKKSIKVNYLYNLIYQVFTLVTPLITAPYLARVLGADGIGLYSYTESVVSYFLLFAALGTATYGQREIAYVQDNRKERSRVFWETKLLNLVSAAAVLAVYYPFALMQENRALYLVFSLNILATMIDVSWFFQGLEEFGKIVLRNIIAKLIGIVFVFLFVKTKEDVVVYALGGLGVSFLGNLCMWFGIAKYIDRPDWKNMRPFKRLPEVLSLFLPTIATQIYTVLDKTMIGWITHSDVENGYYEQAIKLSRMVLMVVTALGTVMIPRIGYHFERNETEQVQQYMYRGYRFVWLLGIPLCFGLIGVASSLVPWFYGDGYEKVVPLLWILSFLILAIGINNVTGLQYLVPTKRQNTFTLTVVIGAAVNFVLNAILIPRFASIGAAVASVIAEMTIAVVQIVIIRKELSPWKIVQPAWKYVISGGVMLTVVVLLNRCMAPSILETLLLACSGAVVYFAMLLILRDSFFIESVKSVFGRFIKKG